MKSRAELLDHLASLRTALAAPCDCARRDDFLPGATGGVSHTDACHIGGMILRANIDMLEWVLEQNPRYEEVVDVMAQRRGMA